MKIALNSFVYAFTALFAAIAMLGEGLHFLPGIEHACAHRQDCQIEAPTYHLHGDCACHANCGGDSTLAAAQTAKSPTNNPANCAVCKFCSLAKSCPPECHIGVENACTAGRLTIASSLSEGRYSAVYHSRAPPSCAQA